MDSNVYTRLLYTTADFDATGRFPVSSAGSKYAYQLVSCFNGNIHVEPMTSRTSASYIAAYESTFSHWSRYGHVPSFIRLDAETSLDLEKFLVDEKKVTFQYFPTGTHRANRAERCIRTWKSHFISILATASPKFPMSYWNKLIPLAEITLNCLLPWQPNPAISAYHGLTGAPFDFRAHPIAPASTAILIHEVPEKRGTWAGHGVPGYYLSPALTRYRSHHAFVTATSAPRVTDTVAWFPETEVTPPPPNATEMLVAAIKDFSRALKHFNLTGNFIPPTLVQDLEALASLHTGSVEPCTSPTNVAPSLPLVPAPRPEPRVLQPAVHTPSVQEIRVAEPPNPLPEPRVATLAPSVQESRVVLPTLAIANPVLSTPLAPLPIIALTSLPYPPPPGLPPLPNTDQPNHLLDTSVSAPTVPTAPLPRRSERPPKSTRTSDIYAYSSGIDPSPTPVPAPYIAIVHGDLDMISTPHLTRLEVANFLSVADAAWLRNTDHLARANAASVIERFECTDLFDDDSEIGNAPANAYATAPLNVNPDGSPLTYRTATHGPESEDWQTAEAAEIDRLLDTTTMHAIHLHQQPSDRGGDTTYYNPKPKEKYDDEMNKVYRIRGTAGGDRINYDGPTKANTAALSTVKLLLQSIVSDNANFMTLDIKDFYLMTPLPRSEYIRIPLKFLSAQILAKHNLHPLFSPIQYYSKLPKACTVYHTRERSHKTTSSSVWLLMVTCRLALPASSVTSTTVWLSLLLSMTSASSFTMLRVPMILSAASSYITHSRSRKTPPSTSVLPSL